MVAQGRLSFLTSTTRPNRPKRNAARHADRLRIGAVHALSPGTANAGGCLSGRLARHSAPTPFPRRTLLYRRTIAARRPRQRAGASPGDGRVHTHVPEEMSIGGLIGARVRGAWCRALRARAVVDVRLARRASPFGLSLLVAFSVGPRWSSAASASPYSTRAIWCRTVPAFMSSKAVRYHAGRQRRLHRLRRDCDDVGVARTGCTDVTPAIFQRLR